jgi:predicted nucleotidyltransferase
VISRKKILDVAARIAQQFRPSKIILFGSYAYGTPTVDSDVDLLVLMPYRGESHKMATQIRLAIDIPFPADILVRSPAELRKRIQLNDFFMQEINEKGEVLHDASHIGMGKESGRRFHKRSARLSSPQKSKLRQRLLPRPAMR